MAQRYSASVFIAAVKGSGGIIAVVLKRVGCSYETFQRYRDKYPTVKEAWETELIDGLGEAHSVVMGNILASRAGQEKEPGEQQDSSDAKWYLSRMGKQLGFGDTPAVQVTQNTFSLAEFRKRAKERLEQVEDLES